MDICPIFHTNLSKRSILCLAPAGKQQPDEPPSLYDCVADLGLDKFLVVDDTPAAFMTLYKASQDGPQMVFGLRLIVCNDIDYKEAGAQNTHAKYNVIAKNGEGYKDLSRIYSFAATIGHWRISKTERYDRIDWGNLKRMWSKDLILMPCFYDGPVYQNCLTFSEHLPDYDSFDPVFEIQDHDLPYDKIIRDKTMKMAGGSVSKTHSVYYRFRNEFDAFITYRAILNRKPGRKSGYYEPNLDGCIRDNFCTEVLK